MWQTSLAVPLCFDLEGQSLAGARVNAKTALDASVGVNFGDLVNGQSLARALVRAGATTNTKISINGNCHDDPLFLSRRLPRHCKNDNYGHQWQ